MRTQASKSNEDCRESLGRGKERKSGLMIHLLLSRWSCKVAGNDDSLASQRFRSPYKVRVRIFSVISTAWGMRVSCRFASVRYRLIERFLPGKFIPHPVGRRGENIVSASVFVIGIETARFTGFLFIYEVERSYVGIGNTDKLPQQARNSSANSVIFPGLSRSESDNGISKIIQSDGSCRPPER